MKDSSIGILGHIRTMGTCRKKHCNDAPSNHKAGSRELITMWKFAVVPRDRVVRGQFEVLRIVGDLANK
jgi:hypothetical protein